MHKKIGNDWMEGERMGFLYNFNRGIGTQNDRLLIILSVEREARAIKPFIYSVARLTAHGSAERI